MKRIKKLKEYEDFVIKMLSPKSGKDFESRMTTACMGLCGESGEFSDIFKKVLFHEMPFTEDSKTKAIKELGDVAWYFALACRTLGVSIEEVIDENMSKLRKRYEGNVFSVEKFLEKEAKKNEG